MGIFTSCRLDVWWLDIPRRDGSHGAFANGNVDCGRNQDSDADEGPVIREVAKKPPPEKGRHDHLGIAPRSMRLIALQAFLPAKAGRTVEALHKPSSHLVAFPAPNPLVPICALYSRSSKCSRAPFSMKLPQPHRRSDFDLTIEPALNITQSFQQLRLARRVEPCDQARQGEGSNEQSGR